MLIAGSLLIPLTVQAEDPQLYIVNADNRLIMAEPPPIIIENHAFVSIAALADVLQGKVVWDAEQQTVTLTKDQDTMRIRVDSAQAKLNGQDLPLEAAVCSVDDRVYVPLVSVAEAMGAKLEWDQEIKTVKLLPGMGSVTRTRNAPVREGTSSGTLTIKVGYFGTPYNTVKVFTFSELEAMSHVRQAYTFIDSMPSVVLDSAQGVKLVDILQQSGIDINSIDKLYFYTTDVGKGWYQSLSKSFLLDSRRYYYPNLPACWDYDEEKALPGAEEGAVEVEPIIAIRDYWKRFATSPDFTRMVESNGFRLVFGQTDTSTCTAVRSAKWIREISVMLLGHPTSEVTLDKNSANALVGSSFQLEATVGPADAVNKKVGWSSSNPGIATVDQNGLVSVIAPGMAVITVTTAEGGHSASCIVNDPSPSVAGQEGSTTGSSPANEEEKESPVTAAGQQRLAPKGGNGDFKRTGKVFEISAEIIPLQPHPEHGNLNIPAIITAPILFLLGAGKRYKEYMKEVAK